MTEDEVLKIRAEGEALENLWFNVLVQSLVDLSTKIETGESAINKENADKWMDLENSEFLTVCSLAGIDPKMVVRTKNKLLKDGRSFRIFKTYD